MWWRACVCPPDSCWLPPSRGSPRRRRDRWRRACRFHCAGWHGAPGPPAISPRTSNWLPEGRTPIRATLFTWERCWWPPGWPSLRAARRPALLFAAVFVLVYLPVISLEEQHLSSLFPAYRDYAGQVPLLVPGRPRRVTGAQRFRFALYMKNQEYQALAGFLAGSALLAWKAWR